MFLLSINLSDQRKITKIGRLDQIKIKTITYLPHKLQASYYLLEHPKQLNQNFDNWYCLKVKKFKIRVDNDTDFVMFPS